MTVRIITGDCRQRLRELPDESVHCVVTSPPYFGLRDYGAARQIGLEPTPEAFVEQLVAVFREAMRVLRPDGTLWLNLGDSYAGSGKGGNPEAGKQATNKGSQSIGVLYETGKTAREAAVTNVTRRTHEIGMKPKYLIGIPWRVAFALQADGWYLRQDIVWAKPNPMPESVTDRCTKSHEYIFLLSKSERYYFDQEAIAEPVSASSIERLSQPTLDEQRGSERVPGKTNGTMKAVMKRSGNKARKDATERGCPASGDAGSVPWEGVTRNKRSVWTVTTQPFSEAHFATFPPALIEPCILAGCPKGGTVLDPFFGAGTTGLVADRLGRNCIGIELNPAYADMAERRIKGDAGMFANVELKEAAE